MCGFVSSKGVCSMSGKTAVVFIIHATLQPATGSLCTCRRARHHYHMFKQQVPYVGLPPAPGRAQRSHTAQSHTSSPRAHRSQPDRWTPMVARAPFETSCLRFDGPRSQQSPTLIIRPPLCSQPTGYDSF